MRRSDRRNNLHICSRRDSNTGGSDLWSSTLSLDHGGAPRKTWWIEYVFTPSPTACHTWSYSTNWLYRNTDAAIMRMYFNKKCTDNVSVWCFWSPKGNWRVLSGHDDFWFVSNRTSKYSDYTRPVITNSVLLTVTNYKRISYNNPPLCN